MKLTRTNPYLNIANSYLIDSPAPININYLYNQNIHNSNTIDFL